jgi:hypothetical protein
MLEKTKKLIPILVLSLIPTFLIWLPFFLRLKSFWSIPLPSNGMATLVANYDGPIHLIIAKTFYNPEIIKWNFQFPLPLEYYAAHFPLFPFLIKVFSPLAGYPYSMLLVTLASSFLALFFFQKLAREYVPPKQALWLTLIFAVFPARWLIVRSIGSSEPLFLAAIIASVYSFQKKKFLSAGIWGAVAQLTKPPAILLFLAYLAVSRLKNLRQYWPIFLIPIALLAVFIIYQIQIGDFFAYFHSGDNIHLFFPPFQIFNYSAPWVGTFWLEEVIFVYLLGAAGLLQLIKQKQKILAWFVGIFFFFTLFISHRDLIRYSLPIVPFLLIAYSDFLVKKEFKIVLAIIVLPIYLFSLAYISQNVMPVSNWAPFL